MQLQRKQMLGFGCEYLIVETVLNSTLIVGTGTTLGAHHVSDKLLVLYNKNYKLLGRCLPHPHWGGGMDGRQCPATQYSG